MVERRWYATVLWWFARTCARWAIKLEVPEGLGWTAEMHGYCYHFPVGQNAQTVRWSAQGEPKVRLHFRP